MTLIFIGGTRGTGKSRAIMALSSHVSLEHANIAETVKKNTSPEAFPRKSQRMRDLPREMQEDKVLEAIEKLKTESKGKTIFVDGHYTSSFNSKTGEVELFPVLRKSAHLFDHLILLKISPEEVLKRRSLKGNKSRGMPLTEKENAEEEKEARFLAKTLGKNLTICRPEEFEETIKQKIIGKEMTLQGMQKSLEHANESQNI